MIKKIKDNINFVIHTIALALTVLFILTVLIAIFIILFPIFLLGTVMIGYKKILIGLRNIKRKL